MKRFRNPVIIVGEGPTALGIERTFGSRGIDVFLISDKREPAGFSRYCKRNYTIKGVSYDRNILKKALIHVGKKCARKPVVYPASDTVALNLAELKDDLAGDYYPMIGVSSAVRTLVDKRKFYSVLAENKIPHPQTYVPTNAEETRLLGGELDYPIFIRPAITQLFHRMFPRGGKGFVAHTSRELSYYYDLTARHGIDVMLQETIPGPATNSYQLEGYYTTQHHPLAIFARQRLRIWPPDFGNTTLCRSYPLVKLAAERVMIDRLLVQIGYHGLMSAEFKKDERDDTLKILEINVRPWWHIWLSERCGVNILLISYLDAIGEADIQQQSAEYEIDIKSIHLTNDIRAAAHMVLTKELTLNEWAQSLKGEMCFTFFSKKDPLPFATLLCFK